MNFLEVYFNGVLKNSVSIQTDLISIGRTADNDVVIDNMGVSNHHAIISKKDNLFFIEDLNSTNGTFLNSQKLSSRQRISIQDSIIIGKHTLKFSEWSHSNNIGSSPASPVNDTTDSTVILSRGKATEINQATATDSQAKLFYLILRGEFTGINKLLLTENSYGIGKSKDNEIRLGGWFTPAYIANIEKIGHSFYISPLKKNTVKLNDSFINSSTLLSASDEIKIKSLFLKFLTD
ncbi:MAG: FHA domain-containing protein [Methylomarinum sp.]|nr:FHA domain-containing protein [Methylomarinum sp.]